MEKEIEASHQDVNTYDKVIRGSNNRILKMIVDENERHIFTVELSVVDSCLYASKYDIKQQKSLKSFKIGSLEPVSFQSVSAILKQVDVQMSYSTKYFDLAIVMRINSQLQLLVIETDKFVKKTVKTLQATKESLLVNQNSVIGCRHITLQGHQEVLYIIHANEFEFFSWQYKKPDQYKDDQIFQQKNILDLRNKGKRVKQLSMKWCRIERFFDHMDCLDKDIQGIDQLLQNQNSVIICFINNIYINLNDLSCNDLPLAGDDLIDSLKVIKISNQYIALSQYFKNSQQTRLSLLKYNIQIQSSQNRQQKVVRFLKNPEPVDNQVTMMDAQRMIEPTFYFDLNQETILLHYCNAQQGCTYTIDTKNGLFKSKRARNIEGKHYYSNQSENLLLLVKENDDRIRMKKSYLHNFFLDKTEPNYQQLIVRGQNKQTTQEHGKYHFICDTFENTMIRVLGDNQIGISHGEDQISLKQPPIQVPQGDIEALKFDRDGLPWVLVKSKNTGQNIYYLFTLRQDGQHRVYLQHEHYFEVQDEIVHGCMFINGYQGIFLATHKGEIVQVDFSQIQFSKGNQDFKKVETLYCNEQGFTFKHGVKDFQMSKDLDYAFMSGYDLTEHYYLDLRPNQQKQIVNKLDLYSMFVEPTSAGDYIKNTIHHMRFSRVHDNILYLIVSSWNDKKNEYKLFKKDLNTSQKAKLCYSFEVNALSQHTEVIRSIDCEEVNQGSTIVINVNQLLTSTQDVSVKEYHCVLHVVNLLDIKQDEIDRAQHLITINSEYNSASTYKILSALKDNFVLIQRYQDAPLQKILQFSLKSCPDIRKGRADKSKKGNINAVSEFERIVNVHQAMQGMKTIKDFNLITLNVLQKIKCPKQDMKPDIEIDSDQGQLIINYQAWDRKFYKDDEWLKKTQFQVKYMPQKQTMQMLEVLKEFHQVTQKVERIDRSNKVKSTNIFNDVGNMINEENRDFIYRPLLQIGGRNMIHILGNYPKALNFIFQNYDERKDGCIVHYDLLQQSPIDICLMNDNKKAAHDIQESLDLILSHMVTHLNDSDYSYLVNGKIKQLVDLNVESIVDVLNSEICTLKLNTEYLNRPCIMKQQEEAKSITWKETKKFHSQTYAKTFGQPLKKMSHEEFQALKTKKGLFGSNKETNWEDNVQYETFAVEELMSLDLMESILQCDMVNRFMFDCKPIQRMFEYKWSLIRNTNQYNFKCFYIMLICLIVNVYTLDLADMMNTDALIYNTPWRLWTNVGFNIVASLILFYLLYMEGIVKGANWIIAFTYWSAVLYQYLYPTWYVWIYSMYGLMFLKLGIKLADYLQLTRGNKLAQDVMYRSVQNMSPILIHYLIFSIATGMMMYCFESSYDCADLTDVEPKFLQDILYFSFYIYSEMNECKPTINLPGDFMVEDEDFPDYQAIYEGFVIVFINFYVIVMVMLFFNYSIALLTTNQQEFKTNKEREYTLQKWEEIISFWKKFHVGKGWDTYSGLKFTPDNLIFRFRPMTNDEKKRDDKHRKNGLLVDLDVELKQYIALKTVELKKDMDVRNNNTMNQILEKLDFKLEKISLQFDNRHNQTYDMFSTQQDSRLQSMGSGSEQDMRGSSNNQSSPSKYNR